MTFTQSLILAVLCGLAAAFSIAFIIALRSRDNSTRAYRFAVQVGLPLVRDDIAERAGARVRRRTIASYGGILIGIAISLVYVWASPAVDVTVGWVLPLAIVLVASFTAQAVEALRSQLAAPRGDVTRVARLRVLSLRDFASPSRRLIPLAVTCAALVILVIAAVAIAGSDSPVGAMAVTSAIIVVVAIGLLVAGRWLIGVVMAQSQPAADTWDLAWDDAFRADTIRAVLTSQALLGWAAFCSAGYTLLSAVSPEALTTWSPWSILLQNAFTFGMVGGSFLYGYGRAFRYYRDRLWPGILASWDSPVPAEAPA